MKSTQFPILIVLVLSIVIVVLVILTIARPSLFQPDIFVQDSQELSLPEGARAHLSKGEINEIAYSPDSSRLAVASSIGVLIHDARTGEELKRLKGHRAEVYSVAYMAASFLARMAASSPVGLETIPSVCGMQSRVSTNEHSKGIQPIAWHSVQMVARLQAGVRTKPAVCGLFCDNFSVTTGEWVRTKPSICGMSPQVNPRGCSQDMQHKLRASLSVQMAGLLRVGVVTAECGCGMASQGSLSKISLVMVSCGSSGT